MAGNHNSRREIRNKSLIIIISVAVVMAAIGIVMHLIESSSFLDEQFGDTGDWGDGSNGVYLSFDEADYESDDLINAYLIAGTDGGGDDLGEGYNGDLADFILLLITDQTTGRYAFYQIDRNTMTDVSVPGEDGEEDEDTGYFREQICTAHWYGKTEEERNTNLTDAVSNLLGGISIDGYYVINMEDLDRVNHAIGGVTVTIETDMTAIDPAFTEGAVVTLTDEQTEDYLRARSSLEDDTNAARMARHRQYMQSAYSVIKARIQEDPNYINTFYSELEDCIETDASGRDLSVIANQMLGFEDCGILAFEGETREADTFGDGIEHEEFYADEASIVELLSKVIDLTEAED